MAKYRTVELFRPKLGGLDYTDAAGSRWKADIPVTRRGSDDFSPVLVFLLTACWLVILLFSTFLLLALSLAASTFRGALGAFASIRRTSCDHASCRRQASEPQLQAAYCYSAEPDGTLRRFSKLPPVRPQPAKQQESRLIFWLSSYCLRCHS